jgi:hypothetical protein
MPWRADPEIDAHSNGTSKISSSNNQALNSVPVGPEQQNVIFELEKLHVGKTISM